MKLRYGGKFTSMEALPKADLPERAVIFREPATPLKLNLVAGGYCILALLLSAGIAGVSYLIYGEFQGVFLSTPGAIGLAVCFLAVLPHELLHAAAFGKDAEVKLYFSLKHLMAFVVSQQPISKGRFIFMSILPNLVFGWIPLFIWAFIPLGEGIASFLIAFSIGSISCGSGDYMNIVNALIQMPKGSIQQLSGFHSYWYMPEEDGEQTK